MAQEVLKIGRVIEVNGSKTIGELEANVEDLYRTYRSRKYAIGQIGTIIKIESGDIYIFGIITSLRMSEEDGLEKEHQIKLGSPNAKWIEVELFGQGNRTGIEEAEFEFERGVSTYPLPGQSIYLATVEELRRIYAKPEKPTIRVGTVSQARALPVHLFTDELLGKHFAVLGTTGSGKSCSVALLLQGILKECPYAHMVLIDPHNEYQRAFPDNSERLDPTTMTLPHWMLNFEESIELFVGRTEHGATSQTNIVKDAITKARKTFPGQKIDVRKITVDTPVPYRLGDFKATIESVRDSFTTKTDKEPYNKILLKIESLMEDKRFSFLLLPDADVKDDLSDWICNILRFPSTGKPLSIIDLSGVPSDVVDVIVSVICRTIFDFALWNEKRTEMPLFLVCEEAHRYIPKNDQASFKPTKLALSRIAKEGRKYGVGLGLITQRPSELWDGILSQCNTVIALRLANEQDQEFVKKALPDRVKSLVEALPALRTREALVVGEGTAVPVRMHFDEIPEGLRPRSANIPFAESWKRPIENKDPVESAIQKWREQKR